MSSLAALESEDFAVVKKHRGTLKGQVTVSLNKLEKILGKRSGEDFDHSSISKSEVNKSGLSLQQILTCSSSSMKNVVC